MGESLRDQLLRAGFKPVSKKAPQRSPRPLRTAQPGGQAPKPDLAHAFALRAKAERVEHEAAEREARARAAAKKERKRKLQELLAGKVLNQDTAAQARNFEFADKIRRIYVTPAQLSQLNTGVLGVIMHAGRAVLVARAVALAVQALAPEVVALLVDPDAPAVDDGVPDDLMW